MKFAAFSSQNLKLLREDIALALQEVASERGISISVGRISYSAHTCRVSVECGTNDRSIQELDFHLFAYAGLKPEDLGREFTNRRGIRYKIVGCNSRAAKYPVLAKHIGTGTTYKFGVREVVEYLKREAPAAPQAAQPPAQAIAAVTGAEECFSLDD